MLALCLQTNRDRRQRSSSSSISSGSSCEDSIYSPSDSSSGESVDIPPVSAERNWKNVKLQQEESSVHTKPVDKDDIYNIGPTASVDEEVIVPTHLLSVEQSRSGYLERVSAQSLAKENKDEGTDTTDLVTEKEAVCSDQEYIIKTYTCQTMGKMDVREALVGTNKKFECQVIGFPPPNIRWFKDNVEITHDPRYHFSHNHADGIVSMHIEVIKLSDAGLYQCRAENCEGYAITAAHLQVKAHKANLKSKTSHMESVKMTTVKEVGVHKADESPVVSSRRRPLVMTPSMEEAEDSANRKESAPKFLEKPETLVCREDETIKVFSRCQGSPRPVVTWFRDGKLLKSDGTCRLYDKKDEYYLEIPGCSILDSGEYTCTATNSQGAVFCSFNIHVEGKRISAHDLSAVEEEHSTDVQSDIDKETHFLSRMYVIRDFYEPSKTLNFSYGDVVEVLDTQRDDKWLVRKKEDSLQVAYMPRSYLAQSMGDGKPLASADSSTDSPKTSKQKKSSMRKSTSSIRRSFEVEDSSSGEEVENDSAKETVNPVFVAVADYESPELKVYEGQFLEVLDQTNPHMWLVKTKPTKVNPSRVGWMPASYLEQKDGGGLVDRRNTREVFREDIIQITNKPAEAKVKRRYALGELVEAERDYINDLSDLIEKLEAEDPAKFKNQLSVAGELKDLAQFHKDLFLPELMGCMDSPLDVADAFMKWQEWFESYKDYCGHRIVTDVADSKYDKARESKLKYFTKPISQLKRYESLLKDFIRYTTRAGEDCAPLEQTLNMLMSIVKAIDDQLILNNIYGAPEDMKALGDVLRHDTVTVWDNEPAEGKDKQRHMFLFPSNLVMTKPAKAGGSTEEFEYKNKCELPQMKVYTYPTKSADNERRFELFYLPDGGPIEQYVVQCKNEYSKDAWLRDIADAMIAAGITDFKLNQNEYNDLVKRRLSQANGSPVLKKAQSPNQKTKQHEESPQTETDAYMTASTDISTSYYTAADSEADSALKSASEEPVDRKKGERKEKSPQPVILKPQFSTALLKEVVAAKGGSVKLSVIVGGDPKPTIKWYKDGKELRKWRAVFSQKDNEYSVSLEGLSWDSAGRYKVVATNSHGKEECEGSLRITTKASEVTVKPENEEILKGSKPKFVKHLTSDVAEDGSSIRLDCKISADPEPEIKWLHNYKALPSRGEKYSFLFVDDESYTLIVNEPGVLDAGEYAVVASNKHGEEESTVKVTVGDRPGDIRHPKPKAKSKPEDTNKSSDTNDAVDSKPLSESEPKDLDEQFLKTEEVNEPSRRPSVTIETDQTKSTEIIEEQVAVGEAENQEKDSLNVNNDVRRPSVTVEPEQAKSVEIIEEQVAVGEVEDNGDSSSKESSRRPSVTTEPKQSKLAETVEEQVAVGGVDKRSEKLTPEESSRRPSVTVEPEQAKSAETVEEQVAVGEVEKDQPEGLTVQNSSRRPSVTVEPEQAKSAETIEEQVPITDVEREMAEEPVVTEGPDSGDRDKVMATIEQTDALEEAGSTDDSRQKEIGDNTDKSDRANSSKQVTNLGAQPESTTKSKADTAQEFGVVEEMDAVKSEIDQPPRKKLVATCSLDKEEPTLESAVVEKLVGANDGDNLEMKVSRIENGEVLSTNQQRDGKLAEENNNMPWTAIKEPTDRERDVRAKDSSAISGPLSPILGKPVANRSHKTNQFILSWEVPDYFSDMKGLTYHVESCEAGNDWRRVRSGLKDTGVELPSSDQGMRYRIIVQNGAGEESPPSVSLMVRPGKWKDMGSSSLLSKLEKKYMPTLDSSWEEMKLDTESAGRQSIGPHTGYTSTESDSLYWKSLNKLDLSVKKNLSELMKAYADGYPIEPRFDVKDLNTQFAVEGRKARLMCHVYTHADSDIKWYFKGEKVMMDDRYSSNLYPSGLCVLEFPNMSWSDAGEYKIRVQNRWGVSFKSLELRVSDPPTFLETPKKSYQLNRLDSLKISCRVDGIPFPKVMFYRDWQLIPSASRCVVRQVGPDAHSLTINGVLVKDSGNYQIVAENEAGRIHCTFSILVEEGTKSDGIVSVKKYLLEDYYYILEELGREEAYSIHRVIEKSTGIPMYARIYTNPDPTIRQYAHQQMLAMQSAAHENVMKLVNVIENNQQVVIMYEIVTTTWLEELFSYVSWTESFVAHCIKALLLLARYLHNAHVSLANLQLENIYYDKKNSQIKVDVWNAGWLLNSASLRSKYTGPHSIYCAPEVMSGEVNLASDAWNIGVIAYILLGGVPTLNKDGGISIDVITLPDASSHAKDFISKLLQREYSERRGVEEALRHQWIKTASPDNHGSPLDISAIKAFISKQHNTPISKAKDDGHQEEADVIREKSRTAEEEAWLVDWFAKYKHDHNTYLVPIRELDLPIRLREYRKHFQQDLVEEYDSHWIARTLRTRELPGTSNEEVMKVRLTRDDLVALANQGLALIEQQASEASGVAPSAKTGMVFRKKLDTSALKVGDTVELECEVEGDSEDANGFWYRNDELIMGDIEKNTVLVSDRFTFSYAKDGKLSLVIKSAVPTDAGVYRCSVRTKMAASVSTKARLLVGDVPGEPGRPVAAKVWDSHVYLVWSEPAHNGNSTLRSFKVDCKPQGSDRWIVCHFTQCCSAVIEGLSPSTIYRFRVSAVNDFGYSSYSWASPEVRTLREGSGDIVYTADMEQSVRLSLTPPVKGAAASADLGMEVDITSCLRSRRNSVCDNVDVIAAKSDRAEDLYKFTDEVVHRYSNGPLYKCSRKDTKHEYLAAYRGHTAATSKELDILKCLHHNHIQRLYDLYEQPTQYTLIFHDLSSETVLHRLARKATYTERFVTDAMIQLCNAVGYLHYHDITHGVVHPCNMVLSSLHGQRVVLTDFSQARKGGSPDIVSSIYTEFLAPEVVMNEGVSKTVDIWGVGLCALILLSGKSPFHGMTDEETISRIQYLRFRISSVHPNSSQNAHKFIYTCLKRVPGNRPDAEEVVSHPWLDVGHHLHQLSDEITFPAVEFSDLVQRLDNIKQESSKVDSVKN